MSIILVQDRQDNYHLVDYCAPSGRKYTLCDLVYSKKTIINTFALDNSIHDICQKCREFYDDLYGDKPYSDFRNKGNMLDHLNAIYSETQIRSSTTTCLDKYADLPIRDWDKLNKYKRKLRLDFRQ